MLIKDRLWIACLLSVSAAATAQPTIPDADPPPPNRTIAADLSEVDADFPYQGEFVGTVTGEGKHGLQVIAIGDGMFQARLLKGGLPGAGWDEGMPLPLAGTKTDDHVYLTGANYTVKVMPTEATVSIAGGPASPLKRIVRKSPTLGLAPPEYATVIFDGTQPEHLKNARLTDDGLLMEGADFIPTYRNYRLHVEFRTPYMPHDRGQKRGNSGIYLQSRYEVQVLDSFGLPGEFNEAGALYRYTPPNVNMALPPLQWQTYDIDFQAPLFDDEGKKVRNARITVWHNGVPVHDEFDIERKTGAGKPESPELFPIRLQNHSDPVRYRNIWIIDYDNPPKMQVHPVAIEAMNPAPATIATTPVLVTGPYGGVSHVPTMFYGPHASVYSHSCGLHSRTKRCGREKFRITTDWNSTRCGCDMCREREKESRTGGCFGRNECSRCERADCHGECHSGGCASHIGAACSQEGCSAGHCGH